MNQKSYLLFFAFLTIIFLIANFSFFTIAEDSQKEVNDFQKLMAAFTGGPKYQCVQVSSESIDLTQLHEQPCQWIIDQCSEIQAYDNSSNCFENDQLINYLRACVQRTHQIGYDGCDCCSNPEDCIGQTTRSVREGMKWIRGVGAMVAAGGFDISKVCRTMKQVHVLVAGFNAMAGTRCKKKGRDCTLQYKKAREAMGVARNLVDQVCLAEEGCKHSCQDTEGGITTTTCPTNCVATASATGSPTGPPCCASSVGIENSCCSWCSDNKQEILDVIESFEQNANQAEGNCRFTKEVGNHLYAQSAKDAGTAALMGFCEKKLTGENKECTGDHCGKINCRTPSNWMKPECICERHGEESVRCACAKDVKSVDCICRSYGENSSQCQCARNSENCGGQSSTGSTPPYCQLAEHANEPECQVEGDSSGGSTTSQFSENDDESESTDDFSKWGSDGGSSEDNPFGLYSPPPAKAGKKGSPVQSSFQGSPSGGGGSGGGGLSGAGGGGAGGGDSSGGEAGPGGQGGDNPEAGYSNLLQGLSGARRQSGGSYSNSNPSNSSRSSRFSKKLKKKKIDRKLRKKTRSAKSIFEISSEVMQSYCKKNQVNCVQSR